MRVVGGCPYVVVLRVCDVDDRAQGLVVADRGKAASGFCNPTLWSARPVWLRHGLMRSSGSSRLSKADMMVSSWRTCWSLSASMT